MWLKRIFAICFLFISGMAVGQNLDFFIQQGLQNSPLLKDFQNQMSNSTLDSLLTQADQKPHVDGSAQFLFQPYTEHLGYDNAITNGGNYSALVSVSQVIFNRAVLKAKYRDVNLQKQSVANSYKITAHDLRKIITSSYLTAFADFYEMEFSNSFLKVMTQQKEILKELAEKGVYKQTDYLAFLLEIQNQELQVLQLSNQYNKDLHALRQVCGIHDTQKYVLVYPLLTKMNAVNLNNTLQMNQFRLDSLKIQNQKDLVDTKYHPTLSWFADVGFLSSDMALYKYPGCSVGLNLNLHLYDGNQRRLNSQKAGLLENTRSYYVETYKKQYQEQLDQLNEILTANVVLEEQLKKQQSTANELLEMLKMQLNMGNISILDLINALKNYLSVNHNLHQLQINSLQAMNEYNYLMLE